MVIKIVEYNDLVKSTNNVLYVSIPKKLADSLDLKVSDVVKINIYKIGDENKK